MADAALNAPDGAWNTLYATYKNLNLSLVRAQPQDVDAIERQIAGVIENLLDEPAPHWVALCRKMGFLFEGQLDGLDPEAEARKLMMDDAERLVEECRSLLGA